MVEDVPRGGGGDAQADDGGECVAEDVGARELTAMTVTTGPGTSIAAFEVDLRGPPPVGSGSYSFDRSTRRDAKRPGGSADRLEGGVDRCRRPVRRESAVQLPAIT